MHASGVDGLHRQRGISGAEVEAIEVLHWRLVLRGTVLSIVLPGVCVIIKVLVLVVMVRVVIVGVLLVVVHLQLAHVKLGGSRLFWVRWKEVRGSVRGRSLAAIVQQFGAGRWASAPRPLR